METRKKPKAKLPAFNATICAFVIGQESEALRKADNLRKAKLPAYRYTSLERLSSSIL